MEDSPAFSVWLKQRRKALDLTQPELANRVNCSVQMIEKLEAGARRPSKQVATRLAISLALPSEEHDVFISWARSALNPAALEPSRRRIRQRPLAERLSPPGDPSHRLPRPLTAFIGREREVRAAVALLQHNYVRLVTLTGPPGIGKTRLAIQVAGELAPTFMDGVAFVPLAATYDPALLASAIAQAVGIQESGRQPISERLLDYLRSRHLLLVLDNFEQLLAATAWLGTALWAAPQLKILVTSRATLGAYGEHTLRVPPLTVPPPAEQAGVPEVLEYEAVQLFVARAQAVDAQFRLTPPQAPAVVAICTQLDGLPLAIELAATRTRLFTPVELLTRLQAGVAWLDSGLSVHAPPQQTLRKAVDWSYHLLRREEQRVLARLAVFVGGCTIAAAEAICADPAGPLPEGPTGPAAAAAPAPGAVRLPVAAVGTAVERLLEHSLLERVIDAEEKPRLTMLETLREYAWEHLIQNGEATTLQDRHAEYYLRLAETAYEHLRGAQQLPWLARLEAEHPNLRAALQWALEHGAEELALRLAGALGRFWSGRGYLQEGRQWLERALAQGDHLPIAMRARAHNHLGFLLGRLGEMDPAHTHLTTGLALSRQSGNQVEMARAYYYLGFLANIQSDYRAAQAYFNESLARFRSLGDQGEVAGVLLTLSIGLRDQGEYATAEALLKEGLQIMRAEGNTMGAAHTLNALAMVAAAQDDYAAARELYTESLALFQLVGDVVSRAAVLNNLGNLARHQGDPATAHTYYSECLRLRRGHAEPRGLGIVLYNLGALLTDQGDYVQAHAYSQESLLLRRQMGDRGNLADSLTVMARLALAGNQPRLAVQLLSAATRIRETLGIVIAAHDRQIEEHTQVAAEAQLTLAEQEAAWAVGYELTVAEAVTLAQRIGDLLNG